MDEDKLTDDDIAEFHSCMSDDSKKFVLMIDSSMPMEEEDCLLAILAWVNDELVKLKLS